MESAIEQAVEPTRPANWRTLLLRFERPFLISVGVILFVTGAAKLVSAGGGQRALAVMDPLLMLSYKNLFMVVGLLELGISGYLLFKDAPSAQLPLVAWLSANFLLYRLGHSWMGTRAPCGCLGTLTASLGISTGTINGIMIGMMLYILMGSAVGMIVKQKGKL